MDMLPSPNEEKTKINHLAEKAALCCQHTADCSRIFALYFDHTRVKLLLSQKACSVNAPANPTYNVSGFNIKWVCHGVVWLFKWGRQLWGRGLAMVISWQLKAKGERKRKQQFVVRKQTEAQRSLLQRRGKAQWPSPVTWRKGLRFCFAYLFVGLSKDYCLSYEDCLRGSQGSKAKQ